MTVGPSPNQVLTHAARAAVRQLNKLAPPVAARANSPNQVLTHAARSGGRARRARRALVRATREGLWLEQVGPVVNQKIWIAWGRPRLC